MTCCVIVQYCLVSVKNENYSKKKSLMGSMHGLTEVYLQSSDHTPGSIHSMYICSTLFAFLLRVQNMIFLQFPKINISPTLNNTYSLMMVSEWLLLTDRFPYVEWVSEWLMFNTSSAIFQQYHGENTLIFNEMMIRSTLY